MSRLTMHSRKVALTFMICSFGALSAPPASATTCPPGSHGAAPHCEPNQAKPRRPQTIHSVAPSSIAPTGNRLNSAEVHAPLAQHASAAQTHGIIFVGGKSAINSQPVPPGHAPGNASINSQPVPPGHAVHQLSRPGTPIEHTRKPEVNQDDSSHS